MTYIEQAQKRSKASTGNIKLKGLKHSQARLS